MVIVTKNTPTLDLHGEIEAMVDVLLLEFIRDNLKMKNKVIVVVHGKSTNILTRKVHDYLASCKDVKSFKLDNWNLGQTIIELNV